MLRISLLAILICLMFSEWFCFDGPIEIQVLVPKHPIDKKSQINDKMKETDTLLYKATQGLYPGHFFLHMHTPKTGGTTFREVISVTDNQNLNCGYATANHPHSFSIGKIIDSNKCTYFTYEMREVDACAELEKDNCLLGNFLTHYKCERRCAVENMNNNYNAKSNKTIHVMNLFRNPIQHVLSAIAHIAAHKTDTNNRCGSLHEYVDSGGKCITYPINNMQTHVMSHPTSIDVALRKLDKIFFVGILELYEPSVCVLGYQLGQFNKQRCDCATTKDGMYRRKKYYLNTDID
jgi:hypothetical protein